MISIPIKNKITSMKNMEKCPLCRCTVNKTLTTELRRGEGEVQYCDACEHGFLVTANHLDPKQYYSKSYRQEYSHNAVATATNARELFDVYSNYQYGRLRFVSPFLSSETRILEVGASAGQFLAHIKDKVSIVNAIELDTACCAFMRENLGLCVDSELLEDSTFSDRVYDVVCAFQVMEHVVNPINFLEGLRKVTKPSGHIFVEVPNIFDPLLSVWNVPAYQKFYYHTAHLHYFSAASLRLVAMQAGFLANEVDVFPTQDYNLLNHLHWIMNDGPQGDCHVGLREILLNGEDLEMVEWLTKEMRALNKKYISKLTAKNKTSNLMLRLQRGE